MFETFNMGNVLTSVDAIKSARLQRQAYENALAQDERAQQQETQVQGLRTQAFGGNSQAINQLAGFEPQQAAALRSYFDGLSEQRKAKEIAEARQNAEQFGKLALWVKAAPSPQEAAQRYQQALANMPEEMKKQAPPQYDPTAIDLAIMQVKGLEQLLAEAEQSSASQRFQSGVSSALGQGLVASESGGNWQAQNDATGAGGEVGHFGRGQFGVARLNDAKHAGVLPKSLSAEQFMRNPELQMRVEQWHRGDILADAQKNGTYSLIGQMVAGIPVTEQGIVNVAHLGGKEGAKKFFQSGGQYDPADANGTRLSDYLAMGAQEAGAGAGGQEGQPQGPDPQQQLMALEMLYADPSLGDPERQALEMIRERMMGQADQQAEFRQASPEEAGQYGAPAGQFGPDNRFYPINPPGGMTVYGPDGQPIVQTGGAQGKQELQAQQQAQSAGIVLQDIERAKELVASAVLPTTGAMGPLVARVGGTASADLARTLDTIKANIGFDKISAMRQASPTGGALGNVTERELQFLQATLGSLEQSQSQEQFLRNLDRLSNVYQDAMANIAEAAASDGIDPAQFGLAMPGAEGAQPTPATDQPGAQMPMPPEAADAGIDPDLWQFMTPEEQALWLR